MQSQLPSGVPKERNYRLLIESDEYQEMEKFSNNFLSANRSSLKNYSNKWVTDPLHQWSRQWEYPYVFNKIEATIRNMGTARVLDAGSGITFFPYLIKSLNPSAEIYCVDNDESLDRVYQEINIHNENMVNFSCSDLKRLPFTDEWFDIIYCISVLEHTNEYTEIIDGFYRVLKPGGKILITFDISLDGTRDISVENGTKLLNSLVEKFDFVDDISIELKSVVSAPDIFTTYTARDIDPSLLPWKLPAFIYRFHAFIKGNRKAAWPPLLTVFCLILQKKSS